VTTTLTPAEVLDAGEWSDERIQQAWLAEVAARFEADNAAWRAEEEAYAKEHPDVTFDVRDSFLWDVFTSCEITFRWNDQMEAAARLREAK
jgi:hypothetical protein